MVKEAKPSKRAHACPWCDGTFVSPSARDLHVRAVHESLFVFPRQVCSPRVSSVLLTLSEAVYLRESMYTRLSS